MMDIIVVGAGIFGVTAARECRRRGYQVALVDPGPLPHPLAASTDISKVVRMEYGADEQYMAMVETSLAGWAAWNEQWPAPLYHETGVTMLTRQPMSAGGFEYESYQMLVKRGHRPERLNGDDIARRFPAWKPGAFVDGFYHVRGGFAESGRVVAALLQAAKQAGVVLHEGEVSALRLENNRATGVRLAGGQTISAGHVLVAAGSGSYLLGPGLERYLKATGHPVFHLRPEDPTLFTPPHFPVFTADVARTGWYGFPFHLQENVIKIANHGPGVTLNPATDERVVTKADEIHLRRFLQKTFPALANAPVVHTRRCLYADTLDEHLWIDRHPEIAGLSVATGGSGHGFKFAPVLGTLIADAVEGRDHPWRQRFRWRELSVDTAGEEAARHHG